MNAAVKKCLPVDEEFILRLRVWWVVVMVEGKVRTKMLVCLLLLQTSVKWSCVCWLTSPLIQSCSAFLPIHRLTSSPCWPLSGRSPPPTHTHLLLPRWLDSLQGVSFPLFVSFSQNCKLLHFPIILLLWLPYLLTQDAQDTTEMVSLVTALFWVFFILFFGYVLFFFPSCFLPHTSCLYTSGCFTLLVRNLFFLWIQLGRLAL